MHRYVRVGALSAAAGLADDDGDSATVSHGRSLFQQLPFGGERAKAVLGETSLRWSTIAVFARMPFA